MNTQTQESPIALHDQVATLEKRLKRNLFWYAALTLLFGIPLLTTFAVNVFSKNHADLTGEIAILFLVIIQGSVAINYIESRIANIKLSEAYRREGIATEGVAYGSAVTTSKPANVGQAFATTTGVIKPTESETTKD